MKKKTLSGLLKPIMLTAVLVLSLGRLSLAFCADQPERAVQIGLKDGEYAVDVSIEGGSGRATVSSPAVLMVTDGRAYARVEWSSPNYDYMKVGDTKYYPVNEKGGSTFEIPITVFDEPMPVVADTTAMSTPHEVEYTLTFTADSVIAKNQPAPTALAPAFITVALFALCAVIVIVGKKRKRLKNEE